MAPGAHRRYPLLGVSDVDWEAEIARAGRRIAALTPRRPTRSQRRRQQREERKAARQREAQERANWRGRR